MLVRYATRSSTTKTQNFNQTPDPVYGLTQQFSVWKDVLATLRASETLSIGTYV